MAYLDGRGGMLLMSRRLSRQINCAKAIASNWSKQENPR
jgi:hypothetical protein